MKGRSYHATQQCNLSEFLQPQRGRPDPDEYLGERRLIWPQLDRHEVAVETEQYQVGDLQSQAHGEPELKKLN